MESAGHGVPDGGLTVLEAVQGKALVDISAGSVPLEAGAVHAVPAAEAAIAAPAAEQSEDKE